MGSPLAPILANLFMGHHEKEWLENFTGVGPTFYRRYVDDILLVFDNEAQALSFFHYLNERHPSIKFTKDDVIEPGVISFLDVYIKNQGELCTSVYQKETYTGLLTNFRSFVPFVYKRMLVNTLVDRTFKINNTWIGFDVDIKKLTSVLCKNMFPIKMIENIIGKYLSKKIVSSETPETEKETNLGYFKLPYIGRYSNMVKHRLNSLIKRYCKDGIDIKLVFTGCKVKDYFSQKDRLPECFKSFVVYKFSCARCNACYVGKTHRHHITRTNEHLGSDKKSHIFQHLQANLNCRNACDENSFRIIDNAKTQYELDIKEALHIKWIKPDLNKQLFHTTITLIL